MGHEELSLSHCALGSFVQRIWSLSSLAPSHEEP